jgi:hypothetical protein
MFSAIIRISIKSKVTPFQCQTRIRRLSFAWKSGLTGYDCAGLAWPYLWGKPKTIFIPVLAGIWRYEAVLAGIFPLFGPVLIRAGKAV